MTVFCLRQLSRVCALTLIAAVALPATIVIDAPKIAHASVTRTYVLNHTQTILTSSTSSVQYWLVPHDWTDGNNTIEVIGGGGKGFSGINSMAGGGGGDVAVGDYGGDGGTYGGGGGGGAYGGWGGDGLIVVSYTQGSSARKLHLISNTLRLIEGRMRLIL